MSAWNFTLNAKMCNDARKLKKKFLVEISGGKKFSRARSKCFNDAQDPIGQDQLKNQIYLLRFSHTRALLFKKKWRETAIFPALQKLTHMYLTYPHIPSYTLIYHLLPKSWYRDKMSRLKVDTGTKCRAYEHPRPPSKQTSSATYCPGTIYVLGQNVAGQNVSWPHLYILTLCF